MAFLQQTAQVAGCGQRRRLTAWLAGGRGLREPQGVAQALPEGLRLAVNAHQAAGPEGPLYHAPGPPATTHQVTEGGKVTFRGTFSMSLTRFSGINVTKPCFEEFIF